MKLLPYQEEIMPKAIEVLRKHRFLYLTLETRIGKTPVSILAAYEFGNKVMFATQASIMEDIEGTYSKLSMDYDFTGKQLDIVSYDSLHKVKPNTYDVLIVDEAHAFGAYPLPTLRAKELRRISKGCVVIMLSATPTPESYSMIYHQLWAANVDIPFITDHKNFYAWAHKFVGKDKNGNFYQVRRNNGLKANDYSKGIAELILPQIMPYMVEGNKVDAGFAVTAIKEIFLKAIIPDALKQLITTVKKDRVAFFPTLAGEIIILADTAVKLLSKEHQLASGTVIPEGSKEGIILSAHKISAIRFAMHMYKRVAIFYKFIAEKKMLMEAFGDRATDNNQEFNEDESKVYIGQFISKRCGINLEKADAIICLNIDFAYLSYIQMINRMMSYHRTKEAVVIWIFSDNGIEEAIYKTVAKKKNYTSAYYRTRLKKEGWI